MIQCTHDKPACRKKAVAIILLKGIGQEAITVACCIDHANEMLYGKTFMAATGVTLAEAFINGYGVLTENYRVLFLTEKMHQDPATLYELKLIGGKEA